MADWHRGFGWAIVLLCGGLLSVGCGSSNSHNNNDNTGGAGGVGDAGGAGGGDAGVQYAPEPTLDQLTPGWNKIEPGANTMCAQGQPWEFFVRPGKVEKVVVQFESGGACDNSVSCTFNTPLYYDHLVIPPAMSDESQATGMLDHADPGNPFRDWIHIYVPYCTGDLEWGDADHEYTLGSKSYTVHHHGADNVKAVLDWMKRNIKGPTEIFSTGSGGGAFAPIMWAPHLARMYPDARVTEMGDTAANYFTPDVLPLAKGIWNVAASFPDFIPGADLSKMNSVEDLYRLVGKAYPDIQLAEYDSAYDVGQTYFYGLMGGTKDPLVWSADMRKRLAGIAAAVPSFRSYVAPGWAHSAEEAVQFYTIESTGVKLVDWIPGLLQRTAKTVDCGQDCGGPKIMSGSSGWECVQNPTTNAGPLDAALELPLKFVHYAPPTFGAFPGLAISACASGDTTCSSPLGTATTDSAGRVTLHVPGGNNGFDGYFLIKRPNALERWIVSPAIRNPQHPMIGDVYTWGVPDTTDMQQLAKDAGVVYDPSKGVVVSDVLDCNLSFRSDVNVELDGAPPIAFEGPPSYVPSKTRNIGAMWVNVASGKHTVTSTFPGATTPTSVDIDVDAGGFTVLAGLSPQTVQAM